MHASIPHIALSSMHLTECASRDCFSFPVSILLPRGFASFTRLFRPFSNFCFKRRLYISFLLSSSLRTERTLTNRFQLLYTFSFLLKIYLIEIINDSTKGNLLISCLKRSLLKIRTITFSSVSNFSFSCPR